MSKPVLWAELSWEQITDLRDRQLDMVIFPVGATEQHALHLPVGMVFPLKQVFRYCQRYLTGVL